MDPLDKMLRKVRRRLTVMRWVRLTVAGLLVALSAATVWVLLTRLFPMLGAPELLCGVLTGVAALCALFLTFWRRPSLLRAALEADKRLELRERFTSSFELAEEEGDMVDAVHADARNHLDHLDLQRDFPLRPPRTWRWLAAVLLVFGAGYVLLPEFDLFGYRQRQAEAKAKAKALQMKAERIKQSVKPLREAPKAQAEAASALAEEVERIAESMEAGEIGEKLALAKLTNAAEQLAAEKQAMQQAAAALPKLVGDPAKLGMASDAANDIKNGKLGEAADKMRELKDKLAEGGLSEEEKEKLAQDLQALSEMLQGDNEALSEALAKAVEGLQLSDSAQACEALEDMALSLEDMESILAQLKMMNEALDGLSQCDKALLAACACMRPGRKFGQGLGMRGPGRGQGGNVGELPDVEGSYDPTMLPGDMTRGRILASVFERAAPDEEGGSSLEQVNQAFIEVKQQAEQALTKEEIPPGSREFVRQYFGSLEPEAPQDAGGR